MPPTDRLCWVGDGKTTRGSRGRAHTERSRAKWASPHQKRVPSSRDRRPTSRAIATPWVASHPECTSSLFPASSSPLLVLALLAVVPAPALAQSKGDVDNAKSAAERAYQELLDADQVLESGLEELERIQGKIYDLEYRIKKLETALSEYGSSADSLQERARLIVLEAYTSGGRIVWSRRPSAPRTSRT